MNKILRQTALGFGTFGTGCALLALSVNPYLLVLTDTVVGVGMLFAAGSVSMNDLHPKKAEAAGEGTAAAEIPSGSGETALAGLRLSLGSLKPSPGKMGKEEKEIRLKEIDRMLDSTLAGQSKRLISLAEGQGSSLAPAAEASPKAAVPGQEKNLLQALSQADIGAPFGIAEESGEGTAAARDGGPTTASPGLPEVTPSMQLGEGTGEAQAEPPSLPGEGLGADDLLSALKLEAMREKKKDDTSLVRDLKGMKVTGKQLLEELDSLVRDIRRS